MRALLPLLWLLFLFEAHTVCADEKHRVIVPQSSLLPTSFALTEEDEIAIVERLLVATQAQLETQHHLRALMLDFKRQKELFIQGEQTKKQASVMVRTAREIAGIVSTQHLQHLFSAEYMEELTFFSSIAGKNGIKRP